MKGTVAVCALLVACGSAPAAPGPVLPAIPARAATPGDALLARLPAGADAVAELDVARLRAGGALADVVAALRRRAGAGFDPIAAVDAAVAAVYRLGADDAVTLFVLTGPALATDLPGGVRAGGEFLDEHTFLYGPAAERDRARAATASLADDTALLALRAQAMPARATGSLLRVTARLDRRARVAAAGRLGVDEVPATLSAWVDLADDAALVAILGGDDEADAVRLADLVRGAAARAAGFLPAWVPRGDGGGELTTRTSGRQARVVWLLGPRRLAAWARAATRRLEPPSPGEKQP
jgi:hypothetical protein